MKIKVRDIAEKIKSFARAYPVVTLTGPRQSGKTTLCKALFPNYAYVNLESVLERDFAREDPVNFLKQFKGGVIIDEIQRAPDLPSAIQVLVDEENAPGRFILTGSQNFRLMNQVSQSLAGRTALATLLPFTMKEAYEKRRVDLFDTLWTGFYPRILTERLNPTEALGFYVNTYLERDVRELINVRNLQKFSTFLRLAAGRTGQILNVSSLANDAGVTVPTAQEWLTLLEASYVVRRLPPWFANINKRLVKSPKLYFLDTGLAAFLLGIYSPQELVNHPLRGALFETFVVGEYWKRAANAGLPDTLCYYRDSNQNEVDLVDTFGGELSLIEIKSGATPVGDWATTLNCMKTLLPNVRDLKVVYGGYSAQRRGDVVFSSWRDF